MKVEPMVRNGARGGGGGGGWGGSDDDDDGDDYNLTGRLRGNFFSWNLMTSQTYQLHSAHFLKWLYS